MARCWVATCHRRCRGRVGPSPRWQWWAVRLSRLQRGASSSSRNGPTSPSSYKVHPITESVLLVTVPCARSLSNFLLTGFTPSHFSARFPAMPLGHSVCERPAPPGGDMPQWHGGHPLLPKPALGSVICRPSLLPALCWLVLASE